MGDAYKTRDMNGAREQSSNYFTQKKFTLGINILYIVC